MALTIKRVKHPFPRAPFWHQRIAADLVKVSQRLQKHCDSWLPKLVAKRTHHHSRAPQLGLDVQC
jgi:hypothetical protein